MALKLKVGSFIDAPVSLVVRDGSRDVTFSFTLVLRRLTQAESAEAFSEVLRLAALGNEASAEELSRAARSMLFDVVHDWRDQRLVLDDDDKPAPFSREALGLLLDLMGAEAILTVAVMKAIGDAVRTEARDRRGN